MNCPNCNVLLAVPTPNSCPSCGHLLLTVPVAMAAPRLVGSFSVQSPATTAPVAQTTPVAPVPQPPATVQLSNVLLWIAGVLIAAVAITTLVLVWINVKTAATSSEVAAIDKKIDNTDKKIDDGFTAVGRKIDNTDKKLDAVEKNLGDGMVAVGRIIVDDGKKTRDDLGKVIVDDGKKTRDDLGKVIVDDGNATRTKLDHLRWSLRKTIANQTAGLATKSDVDVAEKSLRSALKDTKLTVRIEDQRAK